MVHYFRRVRKKNTYPRCKCILILQPSFRSIKRLQHLYSYILDSSRDTEPIVLTCSLFTLAYLKLRGIACRFYLRPFVPFKPDDIDIINLKRLLPLAMTETSQYGHLTPLFTSNYLAKKAFLAYACLSDIMRKTASSYIGVQVVSTEAALADHVSSYLISSRCQTMNCKWISLISPSNLVGLTHGDPSKRRFLLDDWNSANKEMTTRDYCAAQNTLKLHSSSYLSFFENIAYKLMQYTSMSIDYLHSKIVITSASLFGLEKLPYEKAILKNYSNSANDRKLLIPDQAAFDAPLDSIHNQKVADYVVIHFMSSPGESFANSTSIKTDMDIIRNYIQSNSNKRIRLILKLHPHFEDSYRISDLRDFERMGIEIWDPRIERPDYINLLGDKRTIVTTAFGSIYIERILQGLPVFCFNEDMHLIETPLRPDQFFCNLEEYTSWYHQKIDEMSVRLISSSVILDFYNPKKMYPAELINAIMQENK